MMKALLLVFSLLCAPLFATNHYIRAGASGTASGNDWTNACTDFTSACSVANLVRGDTYYVAGGTYTSHTWNKAASGTTLITIKRATIADHGIATGWSDAYDAQVHWGFSQDFLTGYWVFDGVTSPATAFSAGADDPTQYGFTVVHGSCGADGNYPIVIQAVNITVAHLSVTNACGSAFDFTQYAFDLGMGPTPCNNAVMSHVYSEFTSTDVQVQGTTCDGLVIEYLFSKGHWSSPSNHGEIMALGGDNATIRYNYFSQCAGTGCIASGGPALTNFKIYGNVMNFVSNGVSGATGCDGGNGAIAGAGAAGKFSNTIVYNNTILEPGMCFGWFYTNVGTGGNLVKNNIVYGRCDTDIGGSGNVSDSNTYLSCWAASGTETNKQTGSFNPFNALSSSLTAPGFFDYSLKSYTAGSCASTTVLCAGVSLASPYDVDAFGNTRTTRWDRGAIAYVSAPSTYPHTHGGGRRLGGGHSVN